MLLQELKLKNIRSYADQTITFPKGSILLSGDIGSGKSTILLGIEFALFGLSRPDLPGEALLRKGSAIGSAELTFSLGEYIITIARSLKKEKDGIKQLPGYLIINNVKRDLMPVELKAEILALLGYPEEDLAKSKNFIFRYTVYTPQEEMKLILQDDPEFRLDTLRKIFNIDKYKVIRENLAQYLKQFRVTLKGLETRIEPLENLRQKGELLEQELSQLEQIRAEVAVLLETAQRQLQQHRNQGEAIEKLQEQREQLLQLERTARAVLQEKRQQAHLLLQRRTQVEQELSQLEIPKKTTELLQQDRGELEQQRAELFREKASIEERLRSAQRRGAELGDEVKRLETDLALLPEKEKSRQELLARQGEREKFEVKKKQLDELLAKTVEMITKNETLLQQAQEIEMNINFMDICPCCLQTVAQEHKDKVKHQEQGKITHAQNLLSEFQNKKREIEEQLTKVQQEIILAISQENLLARTTLELELLGQYQMRVKEKQQLLTQSVAEITQLQVRQQRWMAEQPLLKAEQELRQCVIQIEQATKRQYLERQMPELEQQQALLISKQRELEEQVAASQRQIEQFPDRSEELRQWKAVLQSMQEEEKNLAIRGAQAQTKREHLALQYTDLEKQIKELREYKNSLIRQKELYHWLEDYFLMLTYTLEKHVMVQIHQLFNQVFQEWFAMLLDDETVSSRLDDSFTPIIEQNGYEVSFANLSGGEKTSAALAYRLALNRVINQVIDQIKTKELLILDEPTDGFSSEQLDKVRDVLDRLNLQQTLLVSHEVKIETFVDNIIRIRKEGHLSMLG